MSTDFVCEKDREAFLCLDNGHCSFPGRDLFRGRFSGTLRPRGSHHQRQWPARHSPPEDVVWTAHSTLNSSLFVDILIPDFSSRPAATYMLITTDHLASSSVGL